MAAAKNLFSFLHPPIQAGTAPEGDRMPQRRRPAACAAAGKLTPTKRVRRIVRVVGT